MIQKYLTYLNSAALVVLLLLTFAGHPAKFGNAPIVPTESQSYDFGLDTSQGIGGGKFYVNSNVVIASTTSGVAGTFTTLQATTSITSAGSLTFQGPAVSTGTKDTVGVCGTSPSIVGANGIGRVTTGNNASTTCTITFGTAFTNKPVCVISAETGSGAIGLSTSTVVTPSVSTLVISQSSSSQFISAAFDYVCIGN